MTAKQDSKREKYSNPCAAAGRIIAFMAVSFTLCAIVKTIACGQGCESCPCGDDGGSNNCPCRGDSGEAV